MYSNSVLFNVYDKFNHISDIRKKINSNLTLLQQK